MHYHKNVYSNPQHNPTSLCIEELITASKPTSDQKFRLKENLSFKGKVYHFPGQYYDIALVERQHTYAVCQIPYKRNKYTQKLPRVDLVSFHASC